MRITISKSLARAARATLTGVVLRIGLDRETFKF